MASAEDAPFPGDEDLTVAGVPPGTAVGAVGTSTSRLSTYLNGQVTPSAAMLVRIERART